MAVSKSLLPDDCVLELVILEFFEEDEDACSAIVDFADLIGQATLTALLGAAASSSSGML